MQESPPPYVWAWPEPENILRCSSIFVLSPVLLSANLGITGHFILVRTARYASTDIWVARTA